MSYASERRATLKAEGFCINGRHHGRATHGDRCPSCRAWHRGFRTIAVRLRAYWMPRGMSKLDEQPVVVIPQGSLYTLRGERGKFIRRVDMPTATINGEITLHEMTDAWLDADRHDEMQALSDLTTMRKAG